MRTAFVSAILLLLAGLIPAVAQTQTEQQQNEPVLTIEAGMHVSMTNRAAISRDGRTLATGSNDKTVRIWNLPDGALRKVLRIPIGQGPMGAVYAVALSPDGRLAAAGGWTKKNDVYIIDVATGVIQRTLGPNDSSAYDLAFSPDGRKIVATIGAAPTGMRMWNVKTGELIAEDKTYTDFGHQVDFSYTGDFAVSAYDGFIRIYDSNGQLLTKTADRGNKRQSGLAFSPDGLELAVGHNDEPRIDILNVSDGTWAAQVDTSGIEGGDVGSVAWSADGTKLFAGGQFGNKDDIRPVFVWPDRGRGKREMLTGGFDTVLDIDTYGEDGVLFVTADPMIGSIEHGQLRLSVRTSKPEFRFTGDTGLMASPDGMRVRTTTSLDGKQSVLFDLNDLDINSSGAIPPDLVKPVWTGFNLKFPGGTAAPLMDDKEIPWQPYETALSLALPPGSSPPNFFLGTSWNIRNYGSDAKLLWSIAVPNSVWDVISVQDGKMLIAALGDGTIRWYRAQDGKELLAFFKDIRDQRWIAWTPQGYYTASAGGEELIGWVVNRSDKEAPDFFAASRFRSRFYRPDVVQQVLKTLDEDQAIVVANTSAGRQGGEGESIRGLLPPVVDLAMDSDQIRTASSPVEVKFRVRSPNGEPIDAIEVLVDGRPLEGRAAIEIPDNDEVQTLSVPVPEMDSEIGIFARSKSGAGEVTKVRVQWDGNAAQMFKPRLYAVVIGVSNYENTDLKLKYAAQDAADFAAAMERQQGGIYGKVQVKLLTDDKATRSDIVEALEWLESEVTARDVGMVFMAGHGVTDNKQRFFFLPVDADLDKLRASAVSRDDMLDTLSSLAGKALMFIDACHSANSMKNETTRGAPTDITAVVNELSSAENGVVMFASSTGRQLSLERDSWKNGAFTEALLEALSGKADFVKDGKLTINEMELYLSDRVKELTEGRQSPVARKPDTIPDFPIAMDRPS